MPMYAVFLFKVQVASFYITAIKH